MKLGIHCTAVFLVTASAFAQDSEQPAATKRAEQILANMPVNVEHRCLGISLVAAALLEGETAEGDDSDTVEDLSQRIYDAEFTKGRVQFHPTLSLGGNHVATT